MSPLKLWILIRKQHRRSYEKKPRGRENALLADVVCAVGLKGTGVGGSDLQSSCAAGKRPAARVNGESYCTDDRSW